jgi:thioredoxin 1
LPSPTIRLSATDISEFLDSSKNSLSPYLFSYFLLSSPTLPSQIHARIPSQHIPAFPSSQFSIAKTVTKTDRDQFTSIMAAPENLIHFKGTNDDLTTLVKNSEGLVVIDFFADWCGPCQNLGQQLPKIAEQYPNVKFVKANVDENKESAGKFKVRSIPHIIFAKGVTGSGEVQSLEVINGANGGAIKAAIAKHQ